MLKHAKELADSGRKVLVILHDMDFRDDVLYNNGHVNITYSYVDRLQDMAGWHGPCLVDHKAYEVMLGALVGVAERQGEIVKQVAANLATLRALLERVDDAAQAASSATEYGSAWNHGKTVVRNANALMPMVAF